MSNTEKTKELDFKNLINPDIESTVIQYQEKVAEIPKLEIQKRDQAPEQSELNPDDFVLESSPTAIANASKTMSPTTEYERESSPDTVEEKSMNGSHSSELDECKAHTNAHDPLFVDFYASAQPEINMQLDSTKGNVYDMLKLTNKKDRCRNLPSSNPNSKLKKTLSEQ